MGNKIQHSFRKEDKDLFDDFLYAISPKGKEEAEDLYGKKGKDLKGLWEGYHFREFGISLYNIFGEEILEDSAIHSFENFKDRPSTYGGYVSTSGKSERIFKAFAKAQDISLLECFVQFLDFCKQAHLPLSAFDNDTESAALRDTISDIRRHIDEENRKAELGDRSNPELPSPSIPASPYKGLENFTFRDAHIFFGRDDRLLDNTKAGQYKEGLVSRIKRSPFTAVFGASGTGKSSIVLAGVAPKLKVTGEWEYCSFRISEASTNNPFQALALTIQELSTLDKKSFLDIAEREKIATDLEEKPHRLVNYLDAIMRSLDGKNCF